MASIGGRADGAHFFDMRGKKIGQLEVGTNWPLEAYVVKDKDIQGFNKAMRQRSRVDRWNSAMSYSQQAILLVDDFNSELVGRPVYTLKLKTDISYWANVFGEWGVKHYSPRSPQIEKAVEEAFGTFPRQIYEQGHWIEF